MSCVRFKEAAAACRKGKCISLVMHAMFFNAKTPIQDPSNEEEAIAELERTTLTIDGIIDDTNSSELKIAIKPTEDAKKIPNRFEATTLQCENDVDRCDDLDDVEADNDLFLNFLPMIKHWRRFTSMLPGILLMTCTTIEFATIVNARSYYHMELARSFAFFGFAIMGNILGASLNQRWKKKTIYVSRYKPFTVKLCLNECHHFSISPVY